MYWLPYSSHTSHHPSQTPWLPWISYTTQKLMLDSCKMLQKQSEAFHTFLWHFFLVQNRILLHIVLLKCLHVLTCIFEIHQLWQSGFSRLYSNSCWSCSFEPEIIKIGQSSHKMYSNNILNFHESTIIQMPVQKKSVNLLKAPHIYITPWNLTSKWTQQKINYPKTLHFNLQILIKMLKIHYIKMNYFLIGLHV